MAVTPIPNDARDSGPAAPSKTETAAAVQSPETPAVPKRLEGADPARDIRETPVAKIQRPPLEATPTGVPLAANTPAREAEKGQQPQAAPNVPSLPDEPQASPSQPLRDLSLRLSTPGQDKVEVKVGGECGRSSRGRSFH